MEIKVEVTETTQGMIWRFFNNSGPNSKIISKRISFILNNLFGEFPKEISDLKIFEKAEATEILNINIINGTIISWH